MFKSESTGAAVTAVTVNGQSGTLAVTENMTTIAWSVGDSFFTIQGKISQEEALKMAEGVKFIK